jgi:uridine phosphorylase
MPARLRPTAPIAPDAILVGDPGRALMLAQELLQQPKMSNHARGLWGYSGTTEAGNQLTVQATGMGGPSASVVLHDLAELGVRRAVRVGTCASLGDFRLGQLVVVTAAEPARGSIAAPETTNEPRRPVVPDPALTKALAAQLGDDGRPGAVVSLDLLHRHHEKAALTRDVADMQTAALLETAKRLGVVVAALLVVAESRGGEILDDDRAETAAKRAAAAAVAIF